MIKVGDTLPSLKLTVSTPAGPKETTTDEVFGGKKAVMFAVPGAFTPTCSMKHMPGYLENIETFKEKGIETVACLSVNDVHVMAAWARDQAVDGRVVMIADGLLVVTKALGLELDLTTRGLGIRSQRFAMVLDDRKVVSLAIEEPGQFEVSRAESVLAGL